MKRNGRENIKKEFKIIEYMGLFMVLFFLCLIFITQDERIQTKRTDKLFNEKWTLKSENEDKEITLPYTAGIPVNTEYTLSKRLPEAIGQQEALAFRSQQHQVEVYIDGELIYQYPEKGLWNGITPSTWNFVDIPKDSSGKMVEIKLISKYPEFQGRIRDIYIGERNDLIYSLREKYLPPFLVSLFIGLIGILIWLLCAVFKKHHIYQAQWVLGELLIFVSLWLCGETKMPITFLSTSSQYFITLLSLSVCPVFFLRYLYYRIPGRYEGILKRLSYLCLGFSFCCIVLQASGIMDLIELVVFMHLILVAALLYGAYVYGKEAFWGNKEGSKAEWVWICIVIVSVVLEIVLFYTDQYRDIGMYIRIALFGYSLYLLTSFVKRMYLKLLENSKLEKQLQEIKIALMVSQIKPHFIYNTLNSIRTLIKVCPDEAYQMVYDFSNYLRGNIDSFSNHKEILFSEELNHIQAYVNIEKVRFKDRVKVIFDIKEEAFKIPPLTVQTLVENAIKHGICKKVGGGCVWIRSFETDIYYIVEVEDDGVGFRTEDIWKSEEYKRSSGLKNIEFRMREVSGGKFELHSEVGAGTKVILKFPKNEIYKRM